MRILIINPNGDEADSREMEATARRYAHRETEVLAVQPLPTRHEVGGYGATIWAAEATLQLVRSRAQGFDAVVIGCFEDPGLYGAREAIAAPVYGIAESAMLIACTLGHRFSVITTPPRYRPITSDLVRQYGLGQRCASVRAVDLPEATGDDDRATGAILAIEARQALEQDGAEVIVLGCSKFSRFDKVLERSLGVPVLDGVACAVKLAEACVGYGLRTSKRLGFAPV